MIISLHIIIIIIRDVVLLLLLLLSPYENNKRRRVRCAGLTRVPGVLRDAHRPEGLALEISISIFVRTCISCFVATGRHCTICTHDAYPPRNQCGPYTVIQYAFDLI